MPMCIITLLRSFEFVIFIQLDSQIFIFHSGIQQWLPWEHELFKMLVAKTDVLLYLLHLPCALKKKVALRGINS